MQPKSTSLIVTTYNWPQALNLVLASILKQSVLPDEVIIADDGSTAATRDLIIKYQQIFPKPLIHSWQEDKGFRVSRARNKAIANAAGEYIILIDGDMLLHPHFVSDHKRAAQKKRFVQGRRSLLTRAISQQALASEKIHFSILSTEIKNKINAIHIPWLSPLVSRLFSRQSFHSVRGCNMAMWKEDLITVNGFNEDFIGWGREDSELVLRLLHNGICRYDLRLGGIAYHLYHRENARNTLAQNTQLLENAVSARSRYCARGLRDHS